VAGARPNFMKVAPVMSALRRAGWQAVLVHTGQHYDDAMSGSFFEDLGMAEPEHYLGVGSGSHAVQTAAVMTAFEPILLEERPDWVLVPGDVNSTLACALVTVKLTETTGARLGHIEAGLRSRDWRMPEEVNRVVTDRCAHLLLTPSRDVHANLHAEGISDDRIAFVGNVMIDTLHGRLDAARALDMPARLGLQEGRFALATLHRPSNVDTPGALSTCLEVLAAVAERFPVVLPLHPRTRKQVDLFGLGHLLARVSAVEPLGYTAMLSLTRAAAVVLTDSGGLQEETTALGVPCITLREQTERPITVGQGTNHLAPWPLSVQGVLARLAEVMARNAPGRSPPEGWDGHAAERIVQALEVRTRPLNRA
jgi:UDP-N-acetylglucosamine 2-epimerase (non-hydrolysing)